MRRAVTLLLVPLWRVRYTIVDPPDLVKLMNNYAGANDWVAVAFVDGYAFGPAAGAIVFGVFVTTMTFGRVVGTVALDRWGRVPVLVGTMLLAITGTTLAVLGGSPAVAVAGVALWGLGTSLGFPVGMSAAADDPARAAARVSVVSTIGYAAFLAGPPLLGFVGDQVGTLDALLVAGRWGPLPAQDLDQSPHRFVEGSVGERLGTGVGLRVGHARV